MISRTRNLQDFIRISSRHARASLLGAKTKRSELSITAQPLMWTSSRLSRLPLPSRDPGAVSKQYRKPTIIPATACRAWWRNLVNEKEQWY
jgi:hypothetical protein